MALPIIILSLASAGVAQEPADGAAASLQKGVGQYQAMDYQASLLTIQAINRDQLSAAGQKEFDEYLAKAQTAAREQQAALASYDAAEQARRDAQWAKAKDGYVAAINSQYLPQEMKTNAKAQLALVERRMEMVNGAAATPAVAPVAAAAETPASPVAVETPVAPAAAEATVAQVPVAMPAPESPSVEAPAPEAPVAQAAAEPADPTAQVPAEPVIVEPASPVDAPVEQAPPVAPAPTSDSQLMASQNARQCIDAGKAALDGGQYQAAKDSFQQALEMDPSSEEARRLLAQTNQLMGTSDQPSIISRLQQSREVARQEARIEFDGLIRRSQELLGTAGSEEDFTAAGNAAQQAVGVMENNRTLFTPEEYRQRVAQAQGQVAAVSNALACWQQAESARQAEAISAARQARIEAEEQQRQARIETLKHRAETLREEKNPTQALEVVEQILQIDPKNDWALGQVEWLRQMVILEAEYSAFKDRDFETQKQQVDLRESEIPWYEYLKYPRNWKEITVMREGGLEGAGGESPADRAMRQRLGQKIPRLNFNDIPLEGVIDFLRQTFGANIYVNWNSLRQVGVEPSARVNLSLQDVTFEKALDLILNNVATPAGQLAWVLDEGVVTISTRDELVQRTVTQVYDIRDLVVRVPNFRAPRVSTESDSGGGGNRGGSTGGSFLANDTESGDTGNADNIPSKSEIITNIVETIALTIDPDSWRAPLGGGTVGSIKELHSQLVVTTTRENHQKIMELLAKLREARAIQISIEARFISVQSGFLENIGLDLDMFFNIGSQLGSGSVIDPWTGAVVPTTAGTSGWGTAPPGNNHLTPIPVRQNSFGFTDMIGTSTGITDGIGTRATADAMTLGGTFLDDIQVDFLIRATQAHQSTRSLTAPRLTLFNGQRANISVGNVQYYVSDLDPVVADNATLYDTIISNIRTGTVLDVEATVSADRRYVTLTLQPRVTALNGFTTYFVIPTGAAGGVATGIGQIQLPNRTEQVVQTTVSVPDGGTLLLGGQKLAGEVEREMGVPLLSKIPVINRAFSNRGFVRDEQTLLILVKPKILIQTEQEMLQGFCR